MQKLIRCIIWLMLSFVCAWQIALAGELNSRQERIDLDNDPSLSATAESSVPSSADLATSTSSVRSAQVSATINGRQSIEYLIDARTGQSLDLDLQSNNAQAGFHITAPAAPRALHKGHGQHTQFSVTLPRDGTYRVLVYLMEDAAQNGESADFSLNIRLRNPG